MSDRAGWEAWLKGLTAQGKAMEAKRSATTCCLIGGEQHGGRIEVEAAPAVMTIGDEQVTLYWNIGIDQSGQALYLAVEPTAGAV